MSDNSCRMLQSLQAKPRPLPVCVVSTCARPHFLSLRGNDQRVSPPTRSAVLHITAQHDAAWRSTIQCRAFLSSGAHHKAQVGRVQPDATNRRLFFCFFLTYTIYIGTESNAGHEKLALVEHPLLLISRVSSISPPRKSL